jgi:hypothetical protein
MPELLAPNKVTSISRRGRFLTLAPREVTSINSKGRFLTTGEPLSTVVFSASPGWLILSAARGGMPELLVPC